MSKKNKSLAVNAGVTAAFQTMTQSINVCISNFESLNQVIEKSNIIAQQLASQVNNIKPATQKVTSELLGWDKAIKMGSKAVDFVKEKLEQIGVMDLTGAFNTLDSSTLLSKTVTNMTGDANLANAALASLRSTVSGTAYGLDTASKSTQNFLTKGMSIGAATDQFRIWADAVSFYGEGTNEQLESVVGAIGEMYSQGTVEPEQLNQLFDAGIGAAEIYAQSVNRSVSDVKNDLSSGAISAQEFIGTVSQALDSGASNGAAKSMEGSWESTFDNMRNSFTSGWVSIFESVDAALASQGLPGAKEIVVGFGEIVGQVMGTVANSMETVVSVASPLYDIISSAGNFLYENWSTIVPIVLGVAAAVGFYYGVLSLGAMIQGGAAIAMTVYHIACALGQLMLGNLAAAQLSLNAAMLANPIVLIAALIVGVLIFALVNWIKSVGDLKLAWMIAMDSIKTATENLHIKFMDAWYGILNMLDFAKLMFLIAGNVIADYVGNMKVNVLMTLQNMINGCINLINDFIGTVNKIFGVNLELITTVSTMGLDAAESEARKHAQRMQNMYQQVNEAEENKKKRYLELANLQDKYDMQQSQRDSDIASKRNEIANKSSNDATNANINSIMDASSNIPMNNINSIAASSAATADNTDKYTDSMDITEEDIKYLRDIAEREIIDRTVFQSLKVDMGGITNTVTNMADLDGIGDYLGDLITTAAASSMEG